MKTGARPDSLPGPLPHPLPLFPLQTVLFPGAVLGLKVFEARYLDLISNCLRSRQPFGVVGLREGGEVGRSAKASALESVGVLAHIEEVDAEQTSILRVRCTGGLRFRIPEPPVQQDDGLWTARAEPVPADKFRLPDLGP